MSLDATRWAWLQPLKATRKLVLLSIADRADEHQRCYPSIARLVQDTGLDRETIMEAIADIEALGLMTVTRRTGSSSIYQLAGSTVQHLSGKAVHPPLGDAPDLSEKADRYPSEKPDRSEVTDQSEKPDRTSRKNPTPTSRKNPTHNLPIEPTKNQENPLPLSPPSSTDGKPRERGGGRRFDATTLPLPTCVSTDQWRRWVAYRQSIKKPISRETAEAQLKQLVDWHGAGHDPNAILATSIRNSWQGIFQPKPGDSHAAHQRQDKSAPGRVARAIAARDAQHRNAEPGSGSEGGEVIDIGPGDYHTVPH